MQILVTGETGERVEGKGREVLGRGGEKEASMREWGGRRRGRSEEESPCGGLWREGSQKFQNQEECSFIGQWAA